MSVAIRVPCGAGNLSEPIGPQPEWCIRKRVPPIAKAEAKAPMMKPTCCFHGVAPTM